MTVQQNRIHIPVHYDIKIEILWDSRSGQTELRIVQGKILNVKLSGLLQEHALSITKQMIGMTNSPLPLVQDIPELRGNNNGA